MALQTMNAHFEEIQTEENHSSTLLMLYQKIRIRFTSLHWIISLDLRALLRAKISLCACQTFFTKSNTSAIRRPHLIRHYNVAGCMKGSRVQVRGPYDTCINLSKHKHAQQTGIIHGITLYATFCRILDGTISNCMQTSESYSFERVHASFNRTMTTRLIINVIKNIHFNYYCQTFFINLFNIN